MAAAQDIKQIRVVFLGDGNFCMTTLIYRGSGKDLDNHDLGE
jgi:hypothetical protein